ncbi:ribonuclease HII [Brachybacterium sp. JB7]|uniref:Ribonuclease n=1 Tax=Brachybacterium alimentarium TaxID=47845 RepID=A0A2A3YH92_9MICO|nr:MULTISPECIES: ribonuclease HII [Brachybacterium]PCC38657.1 ribonuclease HII [Brachybacterium alimentarium]RCS62378.1 ribonuclease HII [Brachybacterium sp. JB7]RCS90210.1 ribonuclease HII [Brachybacterium alimentarium]
MSIVAPTLDAELSLAARCGPGRRVVVGIDEVGRGALAGPVAMGACAIEVVDGRVAALPEGVRDSKKLSALRRAALVDPILDTAHAGSVGWASAAEIDEIGIVPALTRAALRALEALEVEIDAILLDGNVDVLSAELGSAERPAPLVELRVAADRDCASVSAASILAKVARDAYMVELDALAPEYSWAQNKGYGAAVHREAIDRHGTHEHHRRSWRLGSGAGTVPKRSSPQAPAPVANPTPAPAPAPDPLPTLSHAGVLWGDQWEPQPKEERR